MITFMMFWIINDLSNLHSQPWLIGTLHRMRIGIDIVYGT